MLSFGVTLPTFDPLRLGGPPKFLDVARRSEELGFDAVWVGDHLHAPSPVYDAIASLAATAAVTQRIHLGFGVMLLGLRQPAWVAKQLQTIDALAPGRLLLGVGVGGEFPQEFEAVGATVSTRGRRLDEALAVLPDLLLGRSVRHSGPTLQIDAPALEPPVTTMPPIYVGGRSEAALRRAARVGDAWLSIWMTPERIRECAERLAELAAAQQRPRPRLVLLLGFHIAEDEAAARSFLERYTQAEYGMSFERIERWTAYGSTERVTDVIRAYGEVGVDEFVMTALAPDPMEQIRRLRDVRDMVVA